MLRKNGWADEEDLKLAEIVLRNVREGKTQALAFQEAAIKLERTSGACSFRWNTELRNRYEMALEVAKKTPFNQAYNIKEEAKTKTKTKTRKKEKTIKVGKEKYKQKTMKTKVKKAESLKERKIKDEEVKQKVEEVEKTDNIREENGTLREIITLLKKHTEEYERAIKKVKFLEEENKKLKLENEKLKGKSQDKKAGNEFSQDEIGQLMEILNRASKMIS